VCAHCGTAFTDPLSVGQAIRPVPDLPEPLPLLPLVVTDHIAQSSCLSERSEDNAGGVSRRRQGHGRDTGQYGPTLSSRAVYLSTYQLIPMKRLIETVRDLFGVRVCTYPKGPLSTGSHGAPTPTRALPGPCGV